MRQDVVVHLIQESLDTAFFDALAEHQDRGRYPIVIGSVAPEGALQQRMKELDVPAFSLDVSGRRSYALAILRLVRLLRLHDASILHAHTFDPTVIGWLAARVAGVHFVFTRHHADSHIRQGKRWHSRIDAFCATRADRVIAVSEATKRVLVDLEGVPECKVDVVYNGMAMLGFPSADQVQALRSALGAEGRSVALVLGRLHPEKGLDTLLDALPSVVRAHPQLLVLIAGDGPYRHAVEERVAALALHEHVRLLGQRRDVPQLITLASVVVLPSFSESFGFAAVEAMSLGRPVVASAVGGLQELVRDQIEGILIPVGAAPALAQALLKLLGDEELRGSLGANGPARAQQFDAAAMVSGYERVYSQLLEGPGV